MIGLFTDLWLRQGRGLSSIFFGRVTFEGLLTGQGWGKGKGGAVFMNYGNGGANGVRRGPWSWRKVS